MSSPTSVSIININEIENDEFNTNFREAARHALEFLKNKYSKDSITPGDCLFELFNYENNGDNPHLTSLFCLSILMIHHTKNNLDNEDISHNSSESTYQKLLRYTIGLYESKLI